MNRQLFKTLTLPFLVLVFSFVTIHQVKAVSPSLIQSIISSTASTVKSYSATFAHAVTAGDTVVVSVSSWNTSNNASVSTITDSAGNTYVKKGQILSIEPVSVWVAQNVKGANTLKVTVNTTGNSEMTIALHEYAGVATSNVVDEIGQSQGTSTAGSVGFASITSQPSEVLFAAFNHVTNLSPITALPSSGYTLRQSQTNNSTYEALYTEDQVVSTAKLYTAGFTFSKSVSWQGVMVSLRGLSIAPTPTPTPTPSPTASPTPTPTPSATPSPSPTPSPTPVVTPSPTPSPISTTVFRVGPGFVDVIPRQIVRTSDDRTYIIVGNAQGTNKINVYWTPASGLPNSAADFSGTTSFTDSANPISVESVYDGSQFIHVFVNNQSGVLHDFPFDTSTNTFRAAKTISVNNPTVAGGYIGSSGVSGMFDKNGTLHLAYWTQGNRISYAEYTYSGITDTLNLTSGPTILDDGLNTYRHPSLVISPLDGSLAVAWTQLGPPESDVYAKGNIIVRQRDNNGVWGTATVVNSSPAWTSNEGGADIDQGPQMVVTLDGVYHLVYIEYASTFAAYGHVHYVVQNTSGVWNDTLTPFFTHDPALATKTDNSLIIFGHGDSRNVNCSSPYNDICITSQNADSSWTTPQPFYSQLGGDNLDSSPSVKWSVVGWNRPDTIETLFFSANSGSYFNTSVWYGRINTTATPTPTPTASPTPTPTISPTPSPSPTPTPIPSPTDTPVPSPTDTPSPTPVITPTPTPTPSPTNTQSPTPTPSTVPALTQSTIGSFSTAATSDSISFPQPVATGDAVLVSVASWNTTSNAGVSSITDTQGNTYTKISEVTSAQPISIWAAKNVSGSDTLNITVTTTGSSNMTIALHEYTGVTTLNTVDQSGTAQGSGTNALVTLSNPTSQASEVIMAAFTHVSNVSPVTATPGLGYTLRQSQTNNSTYEALYTEDQVVSSISQYQAPLILSNSVSWEGTMVALKGT